MANFVLKDINGNEATYYRDKILVDTAEGGTQIFSEGDAVEGVEIAPDFSGGDMTVNAPEGMLVKSVIILKPENLKPENIKKDVEIAGVVGEFEGGGSVEHGFEYVLNDSGNIVEVKVHGMTYLPAYCFYGFTALQKVDFSDSPNLTQIRNYAFRNCSALTSIVIPDGVTSIGQYAFYGCSALTSVVIPDGVTSIDNYAFQNCSKLTSIVIPGSVTSIGQNAFYGCSKLTSVTIGNGVKSIATSAFSNCSALTSIDIPDSVTSIGQNAFYYCTKLTSVTIGNGVTSIGKNAFQYCTSMTSAIFCITEGWWVSTSSTATSGTTLTASDLENKSTAAKYLRTTYYSYNWKRS